MPIPDNMGPTVADLDGVESELRAAQDRVKTLQKRKDQLCEELLDLFEQATVTTVSTDHFTFYLHRQVWANVPAENKGRCLEVLPEMGLGDMISTQVNSSKLSAFIREQEIDEATGLPQPPGELVDLVNVAERIDIRVRVRPGK